MTYLPCRDAAFIYFPGVFLMVGDQQKTAARLAALPPGHVLPSCKLISSDGVPSTTSRDQPLQGPLGERISNGIPTWLKSCTSSLAIALDFTQGKGLWVVSGIVHKDQYVLMAQGRLWQGPQQVYPNLLERDFDER